MDSIYLPYKSSTIHYLKGGEGKKLLVCLHGYGETAGTFAFLEPSLASEYTLIAIDLPFHGKTQWNEGSVFMKEDLLALIDQIKSIVQGGVTDGAGSRKATKDLTADRAKIYLFGYSMGGRLALSLMEWIPDSIERLLLAAPDGVKVNFWYWLATQTGIGNGLFGFTMRHPGWFFFFLRLANACGMVNQSVYKFTVRYIDNAKVRDELYLRWTTFRKFRPSIGKIKQIIMQRRIPVRLLYGQYDRIIRAATGQQFIKDIEDQCKLVIAPGGHHLLQHQYLETILSLLND